MAEEVIVRMGRYAVVHNHEILTCLSLGSCMGVVVYDHEKQIGGLAHVMLPDSSVLSRQTEEFNMNKFANISIPAVVEQMKEQGSFVEAMTAKIAGGAQMFPGILEEGVMDIGTMNMDAVIKVLENLRINVVASDTGGNIGRTIRFDTSTGKITIRTKDSVKEI